MASKLRAMVGCNVIMHSKVGYPVMDEGYCKCLMVDKLYSVWLFLFKPLPTGLQV